MSTNLTRNSVAYVLDQAGIQPNRIRAMAAKVARTP